ncbi:hypothetical protein M406DRAFT_331145 [Cryphonectria parasitica EP155]|uniref:Uncharacterized protein n=1 Tax=Cryphonectria parasitica (strain ATCC 38755 / EP155) TaxID=660469 RepID=A0A9P4Y1K2_CRYP1|nr:uncharacterized protein M406DRAFT_331145 [Cryphonectria parasitica EP155]KAF3764828.1 hypothetical protein M406DRAFT_331145 [Cryphonectria parasitica EP155]
MEAQAGEEEIGRGSGRRGRERFGTQDSCISGRQPRVNQAVPGFFAELLTKDPGALQAHEYHQTRRRTAKLLKRQTAYLRRSTTEAEPRPLSAILDTWDQIRSILGPQMPRPDGLDMSDFAPNPHIAKLGGKAAQEFVAASGEAILRVAECLGESLEEDIPDDKLTSEVTRVINHSFFLSKVVSGKPPPDIDFERTLDSFEYRAQADLMSSRAHAAAATSDDDDDGEEDAGAVQPHVQQRYSDGDEDNDQGRPNKAEILREAFRFLPHQVADACECYQYCKRSPVRCYINGTDMGVGKMLSGMASIYLMYKDQKSRHERGLLTHHHVFGPNM